MKNAATLNGLFDRIFVITIPRNEARKPFVEEQLSDCTFQFFKGVDAGAGAVIEQLKEQFAPLVSIDQQLANWSNGQTGCWLSHLTLLQKIADEKIERVLILEDDIVFDREKFQEKYAVLKQFKWDASDIFYLGYTSVCAVNQHAQNPLLRNLFRYYYFLKYYQRTPRFYYSKKSVRLRLRSFSKAINRDFDRPGYFYGTHAYAVTHQGAARILDLYRTIRIPVDMSYAEAVVSGKLNGVALNRPLFFQNKELPSSIL